MVLVCSVTIYSNHVNLELSRLSLSVSIGMAQSKRSFGPSISTDCVRFATPVSKKKFYDAANGVVPLNTIRTTYGRARRLDRGVKQGKSRLCSSGFFLSCNDSATVCKYLCYFVLDAIYSILFSAYCVPTAPLTIACLQLLLLCMRMKC